LCIPARPIYVFGAYGLAVGIRRAVRTFCRRVGRPLVEKPRLRRHPPRCSHLLPACWETSGRKTSTNVFRTDEVSALGACTHRPFAKVTRTHAKPHFYMKHRCFPSTPEGRRTRRRIPFWGLQNMCFTRFRPLGHQKRSVFMCLSRAWGVLAITSAPKGLPFDVIC